MDFLSLSDFLSIFSDDKHVNTFDHFLHSAKVRVHDKLSSLSDYMKRKPKLTMDDIKLLHEHIQARKDYLERFYKTSLHIPTSIRIADEPMKSGEMNNNKHPNYKKVIRNMYYKEILQDTKSGIENNPTYMDVLLDLYLLNIIDYKILTPSAIHYMKNGRIGSVFSSYYFRASIMNPHLVYSLNKSVLKGTKIFTPTLGWSSYCYGFLECNEVVEYVGTDVIPNVCEKTTKFAKTYYPNTKIDIRCKPSESLLLDKPFMKKYKEHFDVVFFSPPYYRMELYPSENQSTTAYPTYDEWLMKYWEQTIQLCHKVLAPHGKLCYILSGYGSSNDSKTHFNLLDDMNKITGKYFQSESSIQNMYNKNVHVTSHRETAEKIMIFEKL
jgi:hypothetical protein